MGKDEKPNVGSKLWFISVNKAFYIYAKQKLRAVQGLKTSNYALSMKL